MYFVNVVINQTHSKESIAEAMLNQFDVPLTENNDNFYATENSVGIDVEAVNEEFVNNLAENLFEMGYTNFDIEIEEDFDMLEEIELSDDEDFHENFGYLAFPTDGSFFEAEYQGKTVKLNKPIRGGSKKFYVYVNCNGKVKKISFGDPNMEIKADSPERRKSFRARHNCENPGSKCKARYWSCKKW